MKRMQSKQTRICRGYSRGGVTSQNRTYLGIDVEDTPPPLLSNILNSLDASTIHVPRELRILNERALINERYELFPRHKVVFFPIRLAGSWGSSGVWSTCKVARQSETEFETRCRDGRRRKDRRTGYTEAEIFWMRGEETLEESRLSGTRWTKENERPAECRHRGQPGIRSPILRV